MTRSKGSPQKTNECMIAIKVNPKASKSEVVGWEGSRLKVRIAAVPDRGAANEELIRFLARFLAISPSQVSLTSGAASRHKRVHISGLSEAEIATRLPPR